MIGEKLMEEPKVMGDCWKVFETFGLVLPANLDYTFENASQLVRINNEVFNRLDNQELNLKISELEKKMELMTEVTQRVMEKIDRLE